MIGDDLVQLRSEVAHAVDYMTGAIDE
jgi:hypothetical protein